MTEGLVCGFWDEASRLAGLGWRLGGSAGGLAMRGGEVTAAATEIEERDGELGMVLTAGEERIEAELRPRHDGSPTADGDETAACAATVRVAGQRRVTRCDGYLTRWSGDPTEGAAVLRHMAMPTEGGGVLVALARAASGGSFAEEHSSALVLDADGSAAAYPHAFVSTQYDGSARQTRAGLELWSRDPDAPPVRASGTLLGEVAESDGVSAAILRTSVDGATGLGGYLIWRA
jgi:hypothetical protein